MCIIAIKEAGVEFPDNDIIENCFINNDDGAGFMFSKGGKVHIRKGFMVKDDFIETLNSYKSNIITPDDPLILHFRIATSGKTDSLTTHPFPISRDIKDLKTTEFTADVGLAHNGTIDIPTTEITSDTQEFILNKISSKTFIKGLIKHRKKQLDKIKEYAGTSRFAILTGDNRISKIGSGWISEPISGMWYSNSSYKKKSYTYKYDGKGYGYDGINYNYGQSYRPFTGTDGLTYGEREVKKVLETFINEFWGSFVSCNGEFDYKAALDYAFNIVKGELEMNYTYGGRYGGY